MTPTRWHYTCGRHHGTVFTGRVNARASLADAVIAPPSPDQAGGRAVLATLFDRLPGLTAATVPIGATGLLLGDRGGDTTLIGDGPAELAAVAACLWLFTGRRLNALASITVVERGECGLRALERGSTDLGQQLDRLDQVPPGAVRLIVALGHLGQYQQYVRLVHR